jgi:hypothetical protein
VSDLGRISRRSVSASDRLCLAQQHLALDSADRSSGRSPDGSVLSAGLFLGSIGVLEFVLRDKGPFEEA